MNRRIHAVKSNLPIEGCKCQDCVDARVVEADLAREASQPPSVGSTDWMDARQKPLLGVKPEWLWREERMYDLLSCVARHVEAMRSFNTEWLEELHARMGEVLAYKRRAESEGASIESSSATSGRS